MAVRNCTWTRLLWLLPVRAMLEVASMGFYVISRRPRSAVAVIRADVSFLARLPKLLRQRRRLGGDRRIAQADMRPTSVVWEYFVRRRRTYAAIAGGSAAAPSTVSRESILRGDNRKAPAGGEAAPSERPSGSSRRA
jgi:hypothetical protein